jgi:hypothetical protein
MSDAPSMPARALSPILIIGARRSGTTLLRTMLDRHPGLLVHPAEPQFILALYRRFGHCIWDVPAAVALVRDHPYRPANVEPEELARAYAGRGRSSLKAFVERYLALWGGEALAQKRPVLKDPYFIRNLKPILTLFPDAHLVHIVRDPRANVSSQKARWKDAALWECIAWWRQAARAGRALAAERPAAYTQIRFEDLVMEPEETLAALCGRLGLPYVPELLEFELQTVSFRSDRDPEPVRFTAPEPAKLRQWESYLSTTEVALIEATCRREMIRLGYEPVTAGRSALLLAPTYLVERLRFLPKASFRQVRELARGLQHAVKRLLYCRDYRLNIEEAVARR